MAWWWNARSTASSGRGGRHSSHVAAVNEAQAQSAMEPDWIALAAFAVIAGLATLVIAAQAIAREVRAGSDDMRVLRALVLALPWPLRTACWAS